MLAYTRFELARTLRNARFLVITMVMPALLYLLIDQVYRRTGRGGTAAGTYVLVTMAGFSMINAAIAANCATIPAERASGWLRQLRITPLSGTSWLAARIAQATVVVVPGLLVVALCGLLVGHVQMSPLQWASVFLLVLAGSIPFAFLGLLLGQLLDAQAAQPVQGVLTMLLSVGGGLFFPSSSFPAVLRVLAGLLPTHLFFQLGQEIVVRQAPSMGDIAGLALWAAALAGASLMVWIHQGGRGLASGR